MRGWARAGELARADRATVARVMISLCGLCRAVLLEAQRQHAITGRFNEARARDLDALIRAGQRLGVLPPGDGRPN